jgi:NADP-reducing hydrogenase subunit HndA
MSKNRKVTITDQQNKKILEIIDKYKDDQGALIPTLHEVQEYFGYLPIEVQKIISDELHIPLAEIYGVVTFYTQFSTQPKGKYTVSVCLGTACYVKGSGKILEKFESILGVNAGEVSDDGMFGIEACRCIGACGLAPVVTVNGEVYGRLVQADVQSICDKYMEAE